MSLKLNKVNKFINPRLMEKQEFVNVAFLKIYFSLFLRKEMFLTICFVANHFKNINYPNNFRFGEKIYDIICWFPSMEDDGPLKLFRTYVPVQDKLITFIHVYIMVPFYLTHLIHLCKNRTTNYRYYGIQEAHGP